MGKYDMNDYYAAQKERGEGFQDFIMEQLFKMGIPLLFYTSRKNQAEVGESMNGIEIKFDGMMKETGNLYFEFLESSTDDKPYVNSGILRKDNTWLWIIGNRQEVFFVGKRQLQMLLSKIMLDLEYRNKNGIQLKSIYTSQGFTVPKTFVEKNLALKHIEFKEENTNDQQG